LRPIIDSRLQLAAIVLAEELHYGRAAQKLHIAVSTLSKQIAQLEEKLGMILFMRTSKAVELTEAGRAYVEEARASLLHAEKAVNVARAANEGLEHILTAGHTPYTDPTLWLMLLAVHLPLYPNVKVQLHSDFTFELIHGLLAAELDVALLEWPPDSAALTMVEITQAPLYVAVREWHPASRLEQLKLSDLANDSWILFNKRVHPLLYDATLERARAYGITPKEIHHIVTAEEAVHLVLEHAGVAFLPEAVAMSNQRAGVMMKPLAEEQLRIKTYLAMRADESSRMVNEFARALLRKCSPPSEPDNQMKLPIPG
jgi:DNA-binding transcriptional LysR family regulator